MKFEVIDKETGKVLDIEATSQMSIDTAGRLCGNDSLSGLYALDQLKYEVRFPEHEALKGELEKEKAKNEKWEKFYAALPMLYRVGHCDCEKQDIARKCGIEV